MYTVGSIKYLLCIYSGSPYILARVLNYSILFTPLIHPPLCAVSVNTCSSVRIGNSSSGRVVNLMHPSTPVSVHMCTYIHVWVYVLYMSRNTRNIRIGLAGPSTYVIYIYNIYMCTLKPFSVSTTSVPFAISFWFSLVSLTHKCVVTELDSNEQPLCSRR